MDIYASPRYSYLNPTQFGTFERREVRIYSKWREWKWHKKRSYLTLDLDLRQLSSIQGSYLVESQFEKIQP